MKAKRIITEKYQIKEIVTEENKEIITRFYPKLKFGNVVCVCDYDELVLFDSIESLQNLTWPSANKYNVYKKVEGFIVELPKKPRTFRLVKIETTQQLIIAKLFTKEAAIGSYIIEGMSWGKIVSKEEIDNFFEVITP